jgi:hypothetical protein
MILIVILSIQIQSEAQIKFPDNLEHANSSEPLVDQLQIKGTHWTVINKAARDAIPFDKREIGMLVTWIESGAYVTKRYQGVTAVNGNWTNDANWTKLIDETDTLTYSIYADTTVYSYIAQLAYDADTSTFAWYADTSNFAFYADTSNYSFSADTVNFSYYNDSSFFSDYSDTSNFALYSDTANYAWYADTSNYSFYADTSNYSFYSDTANLALNVNVDSVYFKGIDNENHVPGSLIFHTLTQSLIFHNDILDFNHNLGYELVARVYNESGGQIDNGTVVTLDTIYQNGIPVPTIKRAGKASLDSLIPVGVATVDISDDDYGIITMVGSVSGLNTSTYGIAPGEKIYVGNNGVIQGTKPESPDYSLLIGYMLRVDNDSGSIYVRPEPPKLDPGPHFISDTSNISQSVTINTQDVYEYLPLNLSQTRDNEGFTLTGDSVQVLLSAHYDLTLGMSFQGNPTSEVWRYGIFIDGKPQYTKSRNTTSSSTGDINVISYRYIDAGEWVSWKIKNESGTGDPTIIDMNYQINFRHE